MDNLKALRLQIRGQRCSLDAHEHARMSAAAVDQLRRHRLFRAARRIACYLPNDGELDPMGLVASCVELGKTVYLPVLSRWRHQRLHFLPYLPGENLIPNRFGIPEPELQAQQVIPAFQLDLVIMPLVGFDAKGNRLGMGGGFYDRSFAYLNRRRCWRKPHLLGMAFGFQQVEQQGAAGLPDRPWDVPLTGVVTESGLQMFSR